MLVVEGSPSVLWGVRSAAGERACAGQVEGGRVPVCSQGNARQDPGNGKGVLPQTHFTSQISATIQLGYITVHLSLPLLAFKTYFFFLLHTSIRGTRRYQMTPMLCVYKRSWLGWSWGRRRLWRAWKSWDSRSETWKSTGRWVLTPQLTRQVWQRQVIDQTSD